MRYYSLTAVIALAVIVGFAGTADSGPEAPTAPSSASEPTADRQAQPPLGTVVAAGISAERLRQFHDAVSSRPHRAGTPGDRAVVDYLAETMRGWGLEVEVQAIDVYLAEPRQAELEIVTPDRLTLSVREPVLPQDRFSAAEDLEPGWNAYSGSGEAIGRVVYANFGRKEDYETLDDLGISLKGAIVIARYGGNFRGYKAKFAEARGAAGLILYTDPIDSGWFRGLTYPEGGWAHPGQIQRGSILTLDWTGDPLTPFEPSIPGIERLDPADLALPTIPVQPIGFEAAREILSRMRGDVVPSGWQGALPFTYRVEGGDRLTVRVRVTQERKQVRTHNVIGKLAGRSAPEERVIVGSHHDAWIYGAGDPGAGTILVLEAAQRFAAAAKAGRTPQRSVWFAHWGAEEFGIIGSVEWVEAHREELSEGAVAYINLDGAAMGPDLSASSTPTLKSVIAAAMKEVIGADGESAFDAWERRSGTSFGPDLDAFGTLGGGSDHVGFNCHLGIPAAGLNGGGSSGTSYHSTYDNLHWYRQVVGDDYVPAMQLAEWVVRTAARLVDDPRLPLDPRGYAAEIREALEGFRTGLENREDDRAREGQVAIATLLEAAASLERSTIQAMAAVERAEDEGSLTGTSLQLVNSELLLLERAWLDPKGIPERPWFRSLLVSTDADSGYASWFLPGLRYAMEDGQSTEWKTEAKRYRRVFTDLETRLDRIRLAAEAAIPSASK